MAQLDGKRIAILTSNQGVGNAELVSPMSAAGAAGAAVTHVASQSGDVQTMQHDPDKDAVVQASRAVSDASAAEYDALIIPGGTVNADKLRVDEGATAFIKAFVTAKKPVAVICHGPWTLINAGVVEGKTLTSYPSLQTDLRDAGATWVDEEVFHCPAQGWDLVTSRNPNDLDAFNAKLIEVFAAHRRQQKEQATTVAR